MRGLPVSTATPGEGRFGGRSASAGSHYLPEEHPMRCDDIQWLLSAHADGELSPRQSARVADHLRSCPACAAESRSLERLVSALTALPEEEPPPYLRASIYSSLDVAQPTPWQRLFGAILPLHPARVLAAGAAAAGLVAL